MSSASSASHKPDPKQVRRWRRYAADERAEGELYRTLAQSREGEERNILLGLAQAEKRHESHWVQLLGENVGAPRRSLSSRVLAFLARHFGGVFVLALAQRAENRSPYSNDPDATPAMAADEAIHEEVVRALATRGRARMSGNFRAAVFGANDGLVSNLSLVLGVGASGAPTSFILISGVAGLLAGALSMAAGEYVSVRSQRELLDASRPTQVTVQVAQDLNLDHNELELVYRARGMSPEDARLRTREHFGELGGPREPSGDAPTLTGHSDALQSVGSGLGAALSSFSFFASGALIPVLPYLFGISGVPAIVIACILVGAVLMVTGSIVGILSGASPLKRGLRQTLIGFAAAAITYILGLLVGVAVGK